MGKRLSKIYTRTGDNGSTGLGDGSRVDKDHPRIEAIGTVDELNSAIGLLLSDTLPDDIRNLLTDIQHSLFDVGGELSIPGHVIMTAERVTALESALDAMNSELPDLQEFILPGGSPAAAVCHLSRTVCRRAERAVYLMSRNDQVNPVTQQYLNRLSDLLFVSARWLNRKAGIQDVYWQRDRK